MNKYENQKITLTEYFVLTVLISVITLILDFLFVKRDYTALEQFAYTSGFLLSWNGTFILRVYLIDMILTRTRFESDRNLVAFAVFGSVVIRFLMTFSTHLIKFDYSSIQMISTLSILLQYISIVACLHHSLKLKMSQCMALVLLVLGFEKLVAYMMTGMGF
ncbi:MAG: hypothetical protein NXI20_27660 [bacterium]|nr:hypothetical protein [bacterium]